MEKYCYWEYLDGTVGKGGHEARFMVPATRRFQKLVGALPPRVLSVSPLLQAYCASTADLRPILSGEVFIDTEEQWKWLNSVLAQYLYDRAFIPSCSGGGVDIFPLGTLRLEMSEPDGRFSEGLDYKKIDRWRQKVALDVQREVLSPGKEAIEGVPYFEHLRPPRNITESPRLKRIFGHSKTSAVSSFTSLVSAASQQMMTTA